MGAIMREGHIGNLSTICRAGLLFAAMIPVLTFVPSAFAQTSVAPAAPTPQTATTQPPSAPELEEWRRGMRKVPGPHHGCFMSSYPSTQWQEVQCTTAPAVPYRPARGPRPDTVGNGNDVSAQVTGHISEAVGSFDSVTGVMSETGTNPYTGATNVPNVLAPAQLKLLHHFHLQRRYKSVAVSRLAAVRVR